LYNEKVKKNQQTINKIQDKDDKIQDNLLTINQKEAEINSKKNNLSEAKNAMDRSKAYMNENKLTNKEKLLVEAQNILYSGGNRGVSMGVAFSGLSTTEKARLSEISKELGIKNYDKLGNLITNTDTTTLAMGMARYVLSNNYTISNLAVKQQRYLSASSWYELDKAEWSSISKEIMKIINEIQTLKDEITSLESDKSYLMSQIEDTSDYNDNAKSDITQNNATSDIPLTGYINATESSLFTGISSGIVVTESSGTLDTLSLGVGSNPLLNEGTFTKKPDNEYNYVSWGTWSSTNLKYYTGDGSICDLGQTNNTAYYGQRTPVNDIPTTGSAVYNGEAMGYIKSSNTAVEGTVQIIANFANSTVTGNINITGFANTNINNGQIGGIYTGGSAAYSKTIDGDLSGTDVSSGSMNAQFYGQGAAEMGGTWKITKTNTEEASGVFRAKK
jgi:prefoldin subunit 5